MVKRYARTRSFGLGFRYGTSYSIPVIRENINNGNIRIVEQMTLKESQRLDVLAGQKWGDGTLGWIIAAASDIGWMPQAPPGTLIKIPNLDDVSRYIG